MNTLHSSRYATLLFVATVFGCGKPLPSIYWDTNEEEDTLLSTGKVGQIVPPYDTNGQMCLFPDGTGRFVTGYNPTLPNQNNPGSAKPYMNPPIGEAVWDKHGNFTGQTIAVPGSYAMPGSTIGGDIPPDTTDTFCTNATTTGPCTTANCPTGTCSGTFNDNGSFTGCAFDSHGNLFAADIGQGQGSSSSPDQGRIIEWFPPDYTSYCIIIGPTQGGDGSHHVNGTGGLRNPGTMTVDPDDNLYVPESGATRILKFDHASLPQNAQACGSDGLLTPSAPYTVLTPTTGVPAGVAWDPTCKCLAVTNIVAGFLGGPLIAWYDTSGNPMHGRGPVPNGKFNPFGVAVTPTGDVYFADIALVCDSNGCNPGDKAGGIYKVTFTNNSASAPEAIDTGLDFPIGVTVCDPSKQTCPEPGH